MYNRNTDVHDSNMRVRGYWKYATSNGVSATPTAFVNGVQLTDEPFTVADWEALFNGMFATKMEL